MTPKRTYTDYVRGILDAVKKAERFTLRFPNPHNHLPDDVALTRRQPELGTLLSRRR